MPRDQAPAASTTPVGLFEHAVFERDAFDAAALRDDVFDRPVFHDLYARGLGGDTQRRGELAVIHLVVLRRKNRAGDLAGKTRLAPSRIRCRKPFKR